ncbi:MAG: PspC domain-containing protein [Chloroflexi bacterium]|nr:PspC domain-containing protein [Chloroflexota bacterium]
MAQNEKRFVRSRHNRQIAGVCGGLGEYLNIDPTIIRLLFVLMFLFASGGFWVYVILWIVMPQETESGTTTGKFINEDEPF